jgi:hypothetical protein
MSLKNIELIGNPRTAAKINLRLLHFLSPSILVNDSVLYHSISYPRTICYRQIEDDTEADRRTLADFLLPIAYTSVDQLRSGQPRLHAQTQPGRDDPRDSSEGKRGLLFVPDFGLL